jgi:Phage integrase family
VSGVVHASGCASPLLYFLLYGTDAQNMDAKPVISPSPSSRGLRRPRRLRRPRSSRSSRSSRCKAGIGRGLGRVDFGQSCRRFGAGVGVERVVGHDAAQRLGGPGRRRRSEAAGLVGIHFHDLRHTGNTLAAEAGASLRELMDRMGHSSTRAAYIYQHRTSLRDKMIADEISRRVEAEQTRSGTQRARGDKEPS